MPVQGIELCRRTRTVRQRTNRHLCDFAVVPRLPVLGREDDDNVNRLPKQVRVHAAAVVPRNRGELVKVSTDDELVPAPRPFGVSGRLLHHRVEQVDHVHRPLRDLNQRYDDDVVASKPLTEGMAFLAHGLYRLLRQGCPILGGHILPFAQPQQRVQRHRGHVVARPAALTLGLGEKTVERDYKPAALDSSKGFVQDGRLARPPCVRVSQSRAPPPVTVLPAPKTAVFLPATTESRARCWSGSPIEWTLTWGSVQVRSSVESRTPALCSGQVVPKNFWRQKYLITSVQGLFQRHPAGDN